MREFEINAIGDATKRVTLGLTVGIEMFRILRLSMVNLIFSEMGEEKANEAIYLTGKAAGEEIARTFLSEIKNLDEYVKKLTEIFFNLKVGIVKVLSVDLERGKLAIRVDECVSCSGTPVIGKPICHFEGGIIAGALKFFLKKEAKVVETKCWAMGDATCEFEVIVG